MLSAAIAQFPVSLNIAKNTKQILDFVGQTREGEILVLPEGAVSGYQPDMAFLQSLDQREIDGALEKVAEATKVRGSHVFLGTIGEVEGGWGNLGIYLGPAGERVTYQKCNLATAERGVMVAGDELPVFEIQTAAGPMPLAMQLCREVRYPAQWDALARKGAKGFIYMTNALGGPEHCPVWRAHLISRAAETQRFVLGANAAAPDQTCPTMAVDPQGAVLAEILGEEAQLTRVTIDPSTVADWYLDQARLDIR